VVLQTPQNGGKVLKVPTAFATLVDCNTRNVLREKKSKQLVTQQAKTLMTKKIKPHDDNETNNNIIPSSTSSELKMPHNPTSLQTEI